MDIERIRILHAANPAASRASSLRLTRLNVTQSGDLFKLLASSHTEIEYATVLGYLGSVGLSNRVGQASWPVRVSVAATSR